MFIRLSKAINRLSDRTEAMEDRCTDLERTSRKLDLEFTELYDKVSHQMGRMAKRYASRQAADLNGPNDETETSRLDSLDPISKSIMLRRGGYGSEK